MAARVATFELEPEPMRSHRTTARGVILLLLVGALAAAPAHARPRVLPDPISGKPRNVVPTPQPAPTPAPAPKASLVFPVVGPVEYSDDYGAPRAQGRHDGNDILAPRRALAVAVEAGKVEFWTTSRPAGCMLYLHGESGATYLYVHLNNDLTNGNDNRGKCVAGTAYAKGLKSGAKVDAGQPIGYVGDSGDADGIHPHLHFEVHPGGKGSVNPYPYLRKARPLLFAAKPGTLVALKLDGTIAATAAGKIELRVDTLRASTGLRITKVARTIALALPPSLVVDVLTGLPVTAAGLQHVPKGKKVTIWTTFEPVTLKTMLGTPGALAVDRVQLPG